MAARIRDQIMSGHLDPGSKLPSTQQLMDEYGVVGTTVQKALQLLKAEGIVVGRPGKGVFVREEPNHVIEPASSVPPSAHGRPIEATVMTKAGHLYEMEYRLPVC
ncbi:winged helix-turn-helix domain-containing protein [Streptomyces mobaraensis]|uniref:winged helix-turn-helix domain-containing protein n=1 Tax=Streptomyces mobaraensis TaxID=35621 RepID=UPI0033FFC968